LATKSKNDKQLDAAIASTQEVVAHLLAAYVLVRLHDGRDKEHEWLMDDARKLSRAIVTMRSSRV
jgi:hypothetical protein